jgi:gluconate 2-dehydrogenase gamma chain
MSDHQAAFMFLNDAEAATVEALAECIFPADESGPGAREAQAVIYIDRTLAGFGSTLQRLYRRGLAELNRFTIAHRGGKPFVDLSAQDQVAILKELESWADSNESPTSAPGQPDEPAPPDRSLLYALFAAVREHTIEGVFCDPLYGGNKDFVGWRVLGFPGAQWGYSAEQGQPGFDSTKIPIQSLADLRQARLSQENSKGGEN